MEYYRLMQKAVVFMEEHLKEDLKVKEIAATTAFSPFHFQRLFQAITGFSIQEYIRKRRMTMAAGELVHTERGILSIALEVQYQSQEAFTRAFEQYWGITPGQFRRKQDPWNGRGQQPIDFLNYRTHTKEDIAMNKPVIRELDAIPILGVEYRTTLLEEQYYQDIPDFYRQFGEEGHFMRIPEKAAPDFSYGIACHFEDEGTFSFVVGEQTSQLLPAPDDGDWISMELPAGLYAEFTVDGPAAMAQDIRRYIYGVWLPNSNYSRREGPDFEITDVRQSRFPDRMRMKICLPVQACD